MWAWGGGEGGPPNFPHPLFDPRRPPPLLKACFLIKMSKKGKFSLKNVYFPLKIAQNNDFFPLNDLFRKRFFEKVNLNYSCLNPRRPPHPHTDRPHPPGRSDSAHVCLLLIRLQTLKKTEILHYVKLKFGNKH